MVDEVPGIALDSEILRPIPARSAWVEAGLRTVSSPWTWLSGVLLAASLLVLGHVSAEAAGGDLPGSVATIAGAGHVGVATPVLTRASTTVTRVVTSSPSPRSTATAVTRTLTTATPPLPAPLSSAIEAVATLLPGSPATAASLPVLTAPTVRPAPLGPVAVAPTPATANAHVRARALRSGSFAAPAHADSPGALWWPGRLPAPLLGAPFWVASIAGASGAAFSPAATALLTPLLLLIALLMARPVGRSLRPSMHASRIRRPG